MPQPAAHGLYPATFSGNDSLFLVASIHHHHAACPCWSVAVSMISRHYSRSWALCRADHSPRFCCLRSFSTVRSHVWRGRPRDRLHSFGGSSMPALMAREWSSSESEQTMWPNNLRRLNMTVWVTGGWAVLPGTNCYSFTYPRGMEGWVGLSMTSANNLLKVIIQQRSWWESNPQPLSH